MKTVILLVILGLAVASGMKEAGAGTVSCCSDSITGAEVTGGENGAMRGGTDCLRGHEMTANRSGTAGNERRIGHCPPLEEVNSESTNCHSGSNQHEIGGQSPMEDK